MIKTSFLMKPYRPSCWFSKNRIWLYQEERSNQKNTFLYNTVFLMNSYFTISCFLNPGTAELGIYEKKIFKNN